MIRWFVDQFGILKAWILRNGKIVLVTLILITGGAAALVNLPNDHVPYVDVNGEIIVFPYTDDNSGENVLIRNDREFYGAFNEDDYITFYTLVGNNSGVGQNMSIYPTFADYVKDLQVSRLYQNIPYDIEVPVYEKSCEIVNSTTTDSSEEICKNVLISTETQTAYRDEWRDISLLVFDDEFEISINLSKGNFERKPIPFKYRADVKSVAYIGADEIAYFKMRFRGVPVGITDEFFIEVVGDEGAYGHQDPTITSDWAGFDTITPSSTLVAIDETNKALLDNCVNDSADFKANVQADGDDIRYTTSTAIGSTVLFHEKITYADGNCQIYVRVPIVTSSTDTAVYKWAGNAGASDGSDADNTWGPEFDFVGHFEATSTDSSGTTFRPKVTIVTAVIATSTTGVRGGALGQYYDIGDNGNTEARVCWDEAPSVTNNESFTYSGWCYTYDASSKGTCFSVGSDAIPNGGGGMFWGDVSGGTVGLNTFGLNGGIAWEDTTYDFVEDTWEYYVQVRDADSTMYYVNGVLRADIVAADPIISDDILSIGNRGDGNMSDCSDTGGFNVNYGADARVDEYRVRSDIQSAGSILTEYNNVNSSSTFWVNSGWTASAVARRTMSVE